MENNSNQYFKFEGKIGKIEANGSGAIILASAVGAAVIGVGVCVAGAIVKNEDIIEKGGKMAIENGLKLIKAS